jgi:hypothetical protein
VFNPKALLPGRLGYPIREWLATGGVEKLVKWAAYAVIFVLFAAIIALSVDLIFGSGLFEQGTGCDGQDPYNPCPDERNIYGEDEPYRSQ